jgi:hypothetical protein
LLLSDDFDAPFGNGSMSDVPTSCLNYDPKTKQYTEAKKVVEQAKRNAAVGRGKIGGATCAVAVAVVLVSLLL